jgi:hypothetical protein
VDSENGLRAAVGVRLGTLIAALTADPRFHRLDMPAAGFEHNAKCCGSPSTRQ